MIFLLLISIFSFSANSSCFNSTPNNTYKDYSLLESLVSSSTIPTMDILIGDSKGVLYKKRFGIGQSERFDIASLTKIFTATVLLKSLEDNGLTIKEKLVSLFPDNNASNNKRKITIEDLLRHRSGYKSGVRASELGNAPLLYSQKIRALQPSKAYGKFLYSDINYLFLGELVTKFTKKPLDHAIKESITDPLGLSATSFEPHGCRSNCNMTNSDGSLKVHDPTARKLGGVAGNAGLFTTISDLAKFASLFLNQGKYCNDQVVSSSIVDKMTKKIKSSSRGLGFDITSAYSVKPRGEYFTKGISFGHTGYTGTSLWIDPIIDKFVIVLTNAVITPKAKKEFLILNKKISTLIGKSFYLLPKP